MGGRASRTRPGALSIGILIQEVPKLFQKGHSKICASWLRVTALRTFWQLKQYGFARLRRHARVFFT